MIVSAPAHAALHLPVVPLATSSDPKGSNASANTSKTSPFKNVFDSLTLFEGQTHQGGAQEEGAAVPKSSTKKELTADQGSGTEEASVLAAPIAPQAPAPSLLKSTLILPQAASGAAPDNNEVSEDAAAQELASSNEQTDEPSPLDAKTQPTSTTPLASLARPSLSYSSLRYSSLASQARFNVPGATSTKPAAKVTTSTPSRGAEKAGQQLVPAVSEPTDAPSSILPSVPGKSVSKAAEPVRAQAVPEETTKVGTLKIEAAQTEAVLARRLSSLFANPRKLRSHPPAWRSKSRFPLTRLCRRTLGSQSRQRALKRQRQLRFRRRFRRRNHPGPRMCQRRALEQTALPGQTPVPDPIATPAPAPDATNAPPANVAPQKPARAQAAVRPTSAADPAVARISRSVFHCFACQEPASTGTRSGGRGRFDVVPTSGGARGYGPRARNIQ